MKNIKAFFLLSSLAVFVLFYGCGASNTVKGGVIGGVSGGVVGGVIGNQLGNTAMGAIIGAAVGGTAGVLIGNHMDKQAEEMENEIDGVNVERVGEGIKLTFDSGILFGFDSSTLQPEAKKIFTSLLTFLKNIPIQIF